jgi:hypothetical protein
MSAEKKFTQIARLYSPLVTWVVVLLVVVVGLFAVVSGAMRTRPDGGKWITVRRLGWGARPRGRDGQFLDPSAPPPKPSAFNEDSSEYTGD